MKRCPSCDRTYADDSTTYCLADGALLSPPYDPEATQRIPARLTNPAPTEVLPTSAPPPIESWPPPYYPHPHQVKRTNTTAYVIIALLLVLVGTGIFLAVKLGQRNSAPVTNENTTNANANTKTVELTTATDYLRTPWLGLEVWQRGKAADLFKVDLRRTRVGLSSEPFEIRVPRVADNPPVLVTTAKTDSIFAQLKEGEKLDVEASSYFNPYKAMADTPAGSASLMVDPEAHYVYDDDRMKPLSSSESTIFISSIFEDGDRSLKDQKDDLYLVVFRDLNGNSIVENGEYEFLILDF